VCLLPYENKLYLVRQEMLMDQHVERGTTHYRKMHSVYIESKPPAPIQLEGSEWFYSPVETSVLPGALRVLAPPE
jgi:diacylglycerol kinase family enzyme